MMFGIAHKSFMSICCNSLLNDMINFLEYELLRVFVLSRTDRTGLSALLPILPDAIPAVYECRSQWDQRLRHELYTVAAKQKRTLLQLRSNNNTQDVEDEYII